MSIVTCDLKVNFRDPSLRLTVFEVREDYIAKTKMKDQIIIGDSEYTLEFHQIDNLIREDSIHDFKE